MLHDNVLAESISSFGLPGHVSPSREQLITLTIGQLRDLITQAVQEATEPILQEIQDLKEQKDKDRADFERFKVAHKIFAVQTTNDIDQLFVAVEKATHTPTAPPKGAKTLVRLAKIDEILKARGPTTLKELERILGIDRATMTRLLARLDMRRYEIHSRPGDDREKVLRLKAQIR